MTPARVVIFIVAAVIAAFGTAYYSGALEDYFARPMPQEASLEKTAPDGSDGAASQASGQNEQSTPTTAESFSDGTVVQEDGEDATAAADPTSADKDASQAASVETPATAEAGEKDVAALEDDANEGEGSAVDDTPVGESPEGKSAGKPVVDPAFGLVRVEPDGSMVVAGHAAPSSTVELISGSQVLGSTKSGPGGDFAIVLDEPLKPGSHQIVLRSTTENNVVAASRETAVVSVPETPEGEVLALVEEPGKPSRLITLPEGKDAGKEVASSDGGSSSGKGVSQDSSAPAAGSASEKEGRLASGADRPQGSSGSGPAVRDGKAARDMTGEERPEAGERAGDHEVASTTNGASESRDSSSTGEEAPDTAAAAQETGDKPAAPAKPESSAVFIQAVEIDGDEVFVAGGAKAGHRVRVYANDILLGEANVAPNGRFLIEARRDLPVGDYIVRADLLSDNGAEVIARAAVPFHREPGEKLAAVAPAEKPAASQGGSGSGMDRPAPPSRTEEASARSPQAVEEQQQPSSGGKAAPNGSATVNGASPASESDRLRGAETQRQAVGADSGGQNLSGSASVSAAANAVVESKPESAPAKTAGDSASGAATDAGTAGADVIPLAEDATVVNEPRLQTAEGGAVIIRRGDTLWQISRRVYGHGPRYTTIYLANQQQIRDPDMIWPGQVFSVPDKSVKGESADLRALGDQVRPEAMAGTEPDWRK